LTAFDKSTRVWPRGRGAGQCVPVTVMLGNGAQRVFEGFVESVAIVVSGGMGLQRVVEMDALDVEMMPMCLAQLNLTLINEANRPKLLRSRYEGFLERVPITVIAGMGLRSPSVPIGAGVRPRVGETYKPRHHFLSARGD
jgi:hypothetical protein